MSNDPRADFVAMVTLAQADETRARNGVPRPGDGVVWVRDHEEPLSPRVAEMLRYAAWPMGWSVIRDAGEPGEGR